MPRLKTVEPSDAGPEVASMYQQIEQKIGMVPNILKGMANSPAVLQAYMSFSGALQEASLSSAEHEVVYLNTSEANRCHYCVSAHSTLATSIGLSADEVVNIRRGEPSDPKHRALARFTRRMMETKGFVEDADLEAVRDAGYGDQQIAEAIAVIALATFTNLFNHVNETQLDFPEAEAV